VILMERVKDRGARFWYKNLPGALPTVQELERELAEG
jgi:hypothetical protein